MSPLLPTVAMPFVAPTFVIVPATGALPFGERSNLMCRSGVPFVVISVHVAVAQRDLTREDVNA